MRHRGLITALVLLAVILLGICVRVPAARLSSVREGEQELFRDENGEPYLTEQDSYYYLRLARTMAEEGRIFLFNRRAEDPQMGMRNTADLTAQGDPTLLSVMLLCVWKLLSLFFPVTLTWAARWTAPVLGALAAVPAFLYVRRRAGLAGAVTAGILAGIAVPFTGHTYAGFFDTDCLLALVPLGMAAAQMRAMQEERLGRQVLFAALAGGCFGVLSLLWTGYYTYFWLMLIGGALSALLILLVPFRCTAARRLKALRGLGMTLGFALAFLFLTRGTAGIAAIPAVFSEYRAVTGEGSVFPYVHLYTVEMKPLSLLPDAAGKGPAVFLAGGTDSVLNRAGGLIPCLAAAAGIPLAVMAAVKKGNGSEPAENRNTGLIPSLTEAGMLLLWLAVGLKLTLDWRRCAEIMVLPLSLLAGLGAGFICEMFIREDRPGVSRLFSRIAAAALVFAVCAATVSASLAISRNNVTDITDAKAEAMAAVRENEPENAVIASWWDDGYFMQYASRRRTLADGGTSDASVYWFLGQALLSEDPAQAAGIFRMLETAGVSPLEDLAAKGVGEAQAAALLSRMAVLSREDAEAVLADETELSAAERTALLEKTHPEETKPVLIALSSDLLKKMHAICHYGSLDPETGKQRIFSSWSASKTSRPAVPGEVCAFEMNTGDVLRVRITEDGGAEIGPETDGVYSGASTLSLWEDGVCLRVQELDDYGPAVILIRDNGRLCAFSCSLELRNTLLVRLLVCGERDIPGIEAAGTWYGSAGGDECPAQSLLLPDSIAARGIRLWRLTD